MDEEPLGEVELATLGAVSTATITTQLLARGLRNAYLSGPRRLDPGTANMVGPAFTLRYIPAREDRDVLDVFKDYDHPQRRAIESAPPGAVLVIDARQQTRAAAFGNILATRFHRRGGAGIVTDGAVRDSAAFATLGLPTFVAAASPTTNLAQHHAVDLQQPIACGEVAVYPGDILVGDADGVVCIPSHLASAVARDAMEQERLEAFILSRIEAGSPLRGTYPPSEPLLREFRAL
jgi:regulator of RNase E activity RraA